MLHSVFQKTLRDGLRALLWWGVSLAGLALMVAFFYPSVRDTPALNAFVKQAPEALIRAFAGEMADLTSPAGYLNSQLFYMVAPLLLLIYAIGSGSAAIAGEEERGTLEMLLSNPVPRWRVVAEKAAATVISTVALGLTIWLGLALGMVYVDMGISLLRMAEATLSGVLLAVAFGMLALAVGCMRGERGLSVGMGAP
jgi:ABC-2 type transport system permease protein